jgi:phosphatidylglycerophosphate synthase
VPVDDLLEPFVLASRITRRPAGAQPSGADVARGDALLSMFVATQDDVAVAERRLRDSIFKPTDGRLGRFNRRISIPISVFLIRWLRLSPHAMSAFIILLGLWAGWILSRGNYLAGLTGALVSLAASVLDGCDGELARLQYKESSFGCWFDTIGDYAYYAAVFGGLTVGAARQTAWPGVWWICLVFGAGTLLTFLLLILLRWRITDGRPERLRAAAKAHFYGRGRKWMWLVAKLSTCATRATMPYGILGFAILGLLPAVVVLGAIGAQIYWISLALELRRLLNGSSGFPRSSTRPAY